MLVTTEGARLAELPPDAYGLVEWSPTGDAWAHWTSDSLHLFTSDGAPIVALGPTSRQPGTVAVAGRSRSWSPDGREIAFWHAESRELRVYSLDSGVERTVAGDYRPLAWLGDGATILVARGYEPPVAHEPSLYEIWLVSAKTGMTERLQELEPSFDGQIRPTLEAWLSPDATLAATLVPRDDGFAGLGIFNILTRQLVVIPDSRISYGSDSVTRDGLYWSADGEEVYWLDHTLSRIDVFMANSDGTGMKLAGQFNSGRILLSPDVASVMYLDFSPEADGSLMIDSVTGGARVEIDQPAWAGGTGPVVQFAWKPPAP